MSNHKLPPDVEVCASPHHLIEGVIAWKGHRPVCSWHVLGQEALDARVEVPHLGVPHQPESASLDELEEHFWHHS